MIPCDKDIYWYYSLALDLFYVVLVHYTIVFDRHQTSKLTFANVNLTVSKAINTDEEIHIRKLVYN